MNFSAGLIFETLNGAWTIALSFILVFVLFYLYERWRTLNWRTFLFNGSLPAQFAVAILIADFGNWMVRGATWIWRESGADLSVLDGLPFYGVLIGAAIGTIGILCKLRVMSIARFGHWPWMACATVTVAFVVIKLIIG